MARRVVGDKKVFETPATKDAQRREIQAQVEAYKKRGGQVEVLSSKATSGKRMTWSGAVAKDSAMKPPEKKETA